MTTTATGPFSRVRIDGSNIIIDCRGVGQAAMVLPLVQAAPDLLEACKKLLELYVEATGGVRQLDAFSINARIEHEVRAAIAKAEPDK